MLGQSSRALVKAFFVLVSGVCIAGGDTAPPPDDRVTKVEMFFRSYGCPAPHHAVDYVRAADTHALDYRLLPAISVVESTCGTYERLNNHWGWNSAKTGFPTVQAGIDFVASQLAHGYYYRDKHLDRKLLTYNPRPQYSSLVKRLMHEIDD
jgi:hypothetical protein